MFVFVRFVDTDRNSASVVEVIIIKYQNKMSSYNKTRVEYCYINGTFFVDNSACVRPEKRLRIIVIVLYEISAIFS